MQICSFEQSEAGEHGQEKLLVREIVAAGHPIPTNEQDPPAGKGSISAARFFKEVAWIGTSANHLDRARKSVRIDGHPLQAFPTAERRMKFEPIGRRRMLEPRPPAWRRRASASSMPKIPAMT